MGSVKFQQRMAAILALCAAALSASAAPLAPGAGDELVWDLRAAEHLLNRAGFGARQAELELAVERGLDAVVDELLRGPRIPSDPYFARRVGPHDMDREEKIARLGAATDEPQRLKMRREFRRADLRQMNAYRGWWVDRMVAGEDPLRERMTLFWHGYFTSAYRNVKSSYELINQNQLIRDESLGNFGVLLDAVSRDPAMIEYLDSASNVRKHPNENFARELFELFTLGEGNYTEEDVQEAARAFTGWSDRDSEFRFRRSQHDFGKKNVLGVKGRLTGNHVIEIVLQRDECARFVAGRILTWFEGVEPDAQRLAKYAAILRKSDYEIAPLLGALFRDPDFYRDEIVGQRIASPIDFLVGHARRLGLRPPGQLIAICADALGQKLFDPPSVKGWDEGRAWITTSSMMTRANLAGLLTGEISLGEITGDWSAEDMALDPEVFAMDMEESMRSQGGGPAARRFGGLADVLKHAKPMRWSPEYYLAARLRRTGAVRDEQIVAHLSEELLAIPIEAETQDWLRMSLEEEREEMGIGWRHFLDSGVEAEASLRRLAQVVLSLPEAQLH